MRKSTFTFALCLAPLCLASAYSLKDKPAGFAPPEQMRADGEVIDIAKDIAYAGPIIMDFDGDKKDDLIVTSISGQFRWYKNIGEKGAAEYTHKGLIEINGEPLKLHNW